MIASPSSYTGITIETASVVTRAPLRSVDRDRGSVVSPHSELGTPPGRHRGSVHAKRDRDRQREIDGDDRHGHRHASRREFAHRHGAGPTASGSSTRSGTKNRAWIPPTRSAPGSDQYTYCAPSRSSAPTRKTSTSSTRCDGRETAAPRRRPLQRHRDPHEQATITTTVGHTATLGPTVNSCCAPSANCRGPGAHGGRRRSPTVACEQVCVWRVVDRRSRRRARRRSSRGRRRRCSTSTDTSTPSTGANTSGQRSRRRGARRATAAGRDRRSPRTPACTSPSTRAEHQRLDRAVPARRARWRVRQRPERRRHHSSATAIVNASCDADDAALEHRRPAGARPWQSAHFERGARADGKPDDGDVDASTTSGRPAACASTSAPSWRVTNTAADCGQVRHGRPERREGDEPSLRSVGHVVAGRGRTGSARRVLRRSSRP